MFSGDTYMLLSYTADADRESRLRVLQNSIEKKITFFSLPDSEVKSLAAACREIENCCVVAADGDAIIAPTPEHFYSFTKSLEENYADQLTHYEAWLNKNMADLKLNSAEGFLVLYKALSKTTEEGFVANFGLGQLNKYIGHILSQKETSVWMKSWLLRLVFDILQPFKLLPMGYGAVVQSVFLQANNAVLKGLLHPNVEILLSKQAYKTLLEEYQSLSTEALREADFTPLVKFGLDVLEENLNRVDSLLKNIYRKRVNYDKREPRIKNLLNYLYTNGIDSMYSHFEEFNERQRAIIKYLCNRRYMGTKELSLDFKCDRKTIQRDFGKLLTSRVVRSTGNGSALKYSLNFKNSEYDLLELYQTPIQRREEWQESLFGDDDWITKKPESDLLRA